jgi:glutaredoxin
LKSKDLLERQGYQVEDRQLASRDEVDAFKAKHDVKTTPQTFTGEERVGGFDDSKVPLGFVSLTEKFMMIGMAIWMLSNL